MAITVTPVTTANANTCNKQDHTELWGDVVRWGAHNKVTSWDQCCQQCLDHKPRNEDELECNVWVWCGDEHACGKQYRECWLKHLAHPEGAAPARQGPDCPWTSGSRGDAIKDEDVTPTGGPDRKFHVLTTAMGNAVHWQSRVHYYWFKKHKAECDKSPTCEMGGFTRILHSGHPDDLMEEIPTMVVDPLPKSMVENNWYVVLNRPYAFVQWLKKQRIPEKYILMAEPDHIFIRPLPNFMRGDTPAAFPFFYIEPASAKSRPITLKFTGPLTRRELESLAPVGNSPTFLSVEQMERVMPVWMNTSIAIFKDKDANREWGWVQEMYGFTIALHKVGIPKVDLFLHMMAQPPWDTQMGISPRRPYYIIHYTYGMDYTLSGQHTPGKFGEWRFDKRSYTTRPPPRHLGDPPKGMKNDLVRFLIKAINEASDNLPCWDKYYDEFVVTTKC